jgi:cell shape-determining protein MreC
MSFSKLLNTTCNIQSKSESQGSTGELSLSWSNKATSVPCRIQSGKNASVSEDIGKRSLVGVKVYFEIDVDINEGDRIVSDGITYDVILVAQDSSGDHLEVQASYVFQT